MQSISFFKRFLFAVTLVSSLLLHGCASSVPGKTARPAQSVRELATRISKHIQQPRFSSATWGIKIVSLDTGRTLFEHNARKYFLPASNAKLYSSALALETFSPDYRIPTTLYASAPLIIRNNVFTGDLVLYGRGDPTLATLENIDAPSYPFEQIAARLAKLGLKRVQGDLIVDSSYFNAPSLGSGWQADDVQWPYGAPVSALNVHENTVQLSVKPAAGVGRLCEISAISPFLASTAALPIVNRTTTAKSGDATGIGVHRDAKTNTLYFFGSLAIDDTAKQISLALPNPARAAGDELRKALARYGVALSGDLHFVDGFNHPSATQPNRWHRLAEVNSPPLSYMLQQTLKRSQNLYAQSLLLQAGKQAAQKNDASLCAKRGPACNTEQWGVYALNALLPKMGISTASVSLEEGTGLSRRNLVTPAATTALLQYMDRRPTASVFRASLPIAGVDGTLKKRMRGTAAENNARAKTGFMQTTYALSGYVTSAAKERLAFSIVLNNYVPRISSDSATINLPNATEDIDAMVIMLAEFVGHS